MRTTKIRVAVSTLAATFAVVAVAGPVVAEQAKAAAPKTVKVGSSGNPQLDDLCRQMGDLINDEIRNGINEESNGNYGEANAWYNQARDHIRRAQQAGCVMTVRVPRRARVAAPRLTVGVKMHKKITASAGTGRNDATQAGCDNYARDVNNALDKSEQAGRNGDADVAKGWRDHANDLLRAGRARGCTFSAALIRRLNRIVAKVPVGDARVIS